MSEKYIGIDIGGTSGRVAEFDGLDSDEIKGRERFEVSGTYADDLERLGEAVRSLVGEESPSGIGLGVAGEHAPDGSGLLHSANLKDWGGKPLKADLEASFGCRIKLVNDAEAAAWAEAAFGDHSEDCWVITWGTGVGGGIVEFHKGEPRIVGAPEPGHVILRWDESSPRCNCGRHGCFEAYVGGGYLQKRFGKPPAELSDEELGDVTDWFARGLYDLYRAHPTARFVLGGGVAEKQAARLPEIERKTNGHLEGIGAIEIVETKHGDDAGVIGAMASLRQD
ncbi:MAG TPA: ROK family protein [Patescibacteria group bacterium]|jgi:glucokinase